MKKFSMVLANFPFSDDFWWLKPEQRTDDKTKRARLLKEVFAREGYKDPFADSAAAPASRRRPPATAITRSSCTLWHPLPTTVVPASSARKECCFVATRKSTRRRAPSTLRATRRSGGARPMTNT